MKPRKLALGDRNIIGKRVTKARLAQGMKQVDLLAKLQLAGIFAGVQRTTACLRVRERRQGQRTHLPLQSDGAWQE